MGETLIKVEGLSKKYCRSLKKSMWYGMQDIGSELLGRRHGKDGVLRPEEFWAIKDVNFELKRGECLGLIGHNGAGKTTLLRMLNGLIRPDQGQIEIRGKVGALIALGAGFNPILTGRENIYVNASVLGMNKKHVDQKMDEIIEFSEIREFIDSPVQTYSSGMNVRLGFAVAAILIEPDILFLDEVLAVGDIGFAIKCFNTIRRISNKSAVVFVSHNMQQISWFSTRVMVMDHGRVLRDCLNPSEGIDQYYELVKHERQVTGSGGAEILGFELISNGHRESSEEPSIPQGSDLIAVIHLKVAGAIAGAKIALEVHSVARMPVITFPIHEQNNSKPICLPPGEYRLNIPLGKIELNSGKYSFVAGIINVESEDVLLRAQGLCPFRVSASRCYWGSVVRHVTPEIEVLINE